LSSADGDLFALTLDLHKDRSKSDEDKKALMSNLFPSGKTDTLHAFRTSQELMCWEKAINEAMTLPIFQQQFTGGAWKKMNPRRLYHVCSLSVIGPDRVG